MLTFVTVTMKMIEVMITTKLKFVVVGVVVVDANDVTVMKSLTKL